LQETGLLYIKYQFTETVPINRKWIDAFILKFTEVAWLEGRSSNHLCRPYDCQKVESNISMLIGHDIEYPYAVIPLLSGLIRGVASFKDDNLVVFYYLGALEI